MSASDHSKTITKYFHFQGVYTLGKWITPAFVGIDAKGIIQYLSDQTPSDELPIEYVDGFALPGFPNAHSHAFQYAMAGMAEKHQKDTNDDFWSWREAMYQCALSMDPDQLQTVATMLYIQMLKKGYTHVVEFHYLHHDQNGKPYSNISEISVSLLAAAAIAGIRITLVPVFYQKGGFGKPAEERQRRFIFGDVDEYFKLLEEAYSVTQKITTAQLGFGVHSLRAAEVNDVIEIEKQGPKHIPFHLHAAEQLKEVNDCIAYLKQRPVEWLLNNLPLSERFNIVHCTHLNNEEVERLAKSKANVVLCPGTEANLGDGIFRLTDYAKHDGNWCIGTDSHISLSPLEDLRWMDYAQRLLTHKRNTFDDGASYLVEKAILKGNAAAGITNNNFFESGKPFDAIVIDANSPLMSDLNTNFLLSRIVYATDNLMIGTIINGKWIIQDYYHSEQESVANAFSETLKTIKFQ
ncbi:formimidoylglutamate deiminase [Chryseosolibacter indicus]|uniref:Formimidoylglutamate deiminase n=1 Tax=Chryseosolibacter indicus TaxID=2782351 RepID=A0ABS5VP15_9BACT|nr:formimidoylglutamate deiminase [Chryseosolibacter indicus]MBT1703101.1 formimidoylglutamate deiminase [Chryseosolibacter indicus]